MKKSIALLTYGSTRTTKRCAFSILNFLNREEYDIDVFCHFWNDDLTEDEEHQIIEIWNPKLWLFESLPDFSKEAQSISHHNKNCRDIQTLFWSAYSMSVANSLRQRYEISSDKTYDWIFITRPDLEFQTQNISIENMIQNSPQSTDSPHTGASLNPHNLPSDGKYVVLPWRSNYNGWSVQWAICTQQSADWYCEKFNWMKFELPQLSPGPTLNDEVLLKTLLVSKNYQFITIDVDFKIIRTRFNNWPYVDIPYHADRDEGVM